MASRETTAAEASVRLGEFIRNSMRDAVITKRIDDETWVGTFNKNPLLELFVSIVGGNIFITIKGSRSMSVTRADGRPAQFGLKHPISAYIQSPAAVIPCIVYDDVVIFQIDAADWDIMTHLVADMAGFT